MNNTILTNMNLVFLVTQLHAGVIMYGRLPSTVMRIPSVTQNVAKTEILQVKDIRLVDMDALIDIGLEDGLTPPPDSPYASPFSFPSLFPSQVGTEQVSQDFPENAVYVPEGMAVAEMSESAARYATSAGTGMALADIPENAVESIAQHMIETDGPVLNQTVVAPGSIVVAPGTFAVPRGSVVVNTPPPQRYRSPTGDPVVFVPMNQVSVSPRFSERDILRRLAYPSVALRSGIEGVVYLELFIDKDGTIIQIEILSESPEGNGFGEAAIAAFQGLRCTPAEAKGVPVAVRYRYPVRFSTRR